MKISHFLWLLLFVSGMAGADIQILTGPDGIGAPDPRFVYAETGNPEEQTPEGISMQPGWATPATGTWIGPPAGAPGAAAYLYAFTLESVEGVSLSGEWAGGSAMKISLNGQIIAGGPDEPAFDALHPFSAYAAEQFLAGVNILRFETDGEAAGLHVNAMIAEEKSIGILAQSSRACATASNFDALRAYLESLEGFESLVIDENEGLISVQINGLVYNALLDPETTPSAPPLNGLLIFEPLIDLDGNGLDDFRITYPNGDQQLLYYLGVEKLPDTCRMLLINPVDYDVIPVPELANFLLTGNDPMQTPSATGGTIEIDPVSAAVVRGEVKTDDGAPLPNVIVTVAGHSEFGQTATACDGVFNMAVEGGEEKLIINYQAHGYLPMQRKAIPGAQEFVRADDLIMTPAEPSAGTITLGDGNAPMQAAVSQEVTDDRGSRRTAILFPPGTVVTSDDPLPETVDIHITEYGIGDKRFAKLPPDSGNYPYVAEFTVQGGEFPTPARVEFSSPLPVYVDNFTGLAVGNSVRGRWYDDTKAQWVPLEDGRVISILGTDAAGRAILDLDGSGYAAGPAGLSRLGISDDERKALAGLYTVPDKSLWRMAIPHFTGFAIGGDCSELGTFLSCAEPSYVEALQYYLEKLFDKPLLTTTGDIITIEVETDKWTYEARLNLSAGLPESFDRQQIKEADCLLWDDTGGDHEEIAGLCVMRDSQGNHIDANGDGLNDFIFTYSGGGIYPWRVVHYMGECRNRSKPYPVENISQLYEEPDPVQVPIDDVPMRTDNDALLYGRVLRQDMPVPDVTITVNDHPSFGQTITACDGTYNISVPGKNNRLSILYLKTGYNPIIRKVKVWPGGHVDMGNTIMVPKDSIKDLNVILKEHSTELGIQNLRFPDPRNPNDYGEMTLSDGNSIWFRQEIAYPARSVPVPEDDLPRLYMMTTAEGLPYVEITYLNGERQHFYYVSKGKLLEGLPIRVIAAENSDITMNDRYNRCRIPLSPTGRVANLDAGILGTGQNVLTSLNAIPGVKAKGGIFQDGLGHLVLRNNKKLVPVALSPLSATESSGEPSAGSMTILPDHSVRFITPAAQAAPERLKLITQPALQAPCALNDVLPLMLGTTLDQVQYTLTEAGNLRIIFMQAGSPGGISLRPALISTIRQDQSTSSDLLTPEGAAEAHLEFPMEGEARMQILYPVVENPEVLGANAKIGYDGSFTINIEGYSAVGVPDFSLFPLEKPPAVSGVSYDVMEKTFRIESAFESQGYFQGGVFMFDALEARLPPIFDPKVCEIPLLPNGWVPDLDHIPTGIDTEKTVLASLKEIPGLEELEQISTGHLIFTDEHGRRAALFPAASLGYSKKRVSETSYTKFPDHSVQFIANGYMLIGQPAVQAPCALSNEALNTAVLTESGILQLFFGEHGASLRPALFSDVVTSEPPVLPYVEISQHSRGIPGTREMHITFRDEDGVLRMQRLYPAPANPGLLLKEIEYRNISYLMYDGFFHYTPEIRGVMDIFFDTSFPKNFFKPEKEVQFSINPEEGGGNIIYPDPTFTDADAESVPEDGNVPGYFQKWFSLPANYREEILRTHLAPEKVVMIPEGAVFGAMIDGITFWWNMPGEIHYDLPPEDGQLQLELIDDDTRFGGKNIRILYPDGVLQISHFLGATSLPLLDADYHYDGFRRLDTVRYSPAQSIDYDYDLAGNIETITNAE